MVITWSARLGLGSPDRIYSHLLSGSSPRSEGWITWSARRARSPSLDSDRPTPSGSSPTIGLNLGESGMVIARSLELPSAAGSPSTTGWLYFTGGIAIKHPRHSLHPFFFLQILGTVRIVRNPRYKILTPGPRCVPMLERPLPLDLYYSGGNPCYLRKREDALGMVSSPPTRGRR